MTVKTQENPSYFAKTRYTKPHSGSLATSAVGRDGETTSRSIPSTSYTMTGGEAIRIYDGSRYVVVGTLYPDGTFVKKLKPAHILRTPPAIALQADAVNMLMLRQCLRIRAEIADGRTLVVTFADFMRHGFPIDRGFGRQVGLELRWWQEASHFQPSLFEGVEG